MMLLHIEPHGLLLRRDDQRIYQRPIVYQKKRLAAWPDEF